jgi:hypothetical protein
MMNHRVHKELDGQLTLLKYFTSCNSVYVPCKKSASMAEVTSDGKEGLRLIKRVN